MRDYDHQTMIVTGTGRVSGQPDVVTIQVGITTHAPQLTDAQAENTVRSQSVINGLSSSGIGPDDIQTSSYTVSPQYDYIDGQQHFREYEVQHQLRVTVKDISIVGQIIDFSVKSGATEVSSIQFGIQDTSRLYEQALSESLQNAYAHASALAQAADVQLNHVPLTIQEGSQREVAPYPVQLAKMSTAPEIEPGTLEIQATVTVTYGYR